tara:strand:+ start:617 stop:2206 length:1590 start_codon:yes stop_codon:yes gene_type:complete
MADKEIEIKVKSDIGDVTKDASALAGEFKLMGVSLNDVKSGITSVKNTAVASFSTIKGAVMSTGIGALVIAVGSLVTYFTQTKKGAELLERQLAGLRVVVRQITNIFAGLGETLVGAFQNPKQAISDLWASIKENLVNRVEGLINSFKAVGKVLKGTFTLDWDKVAEGAREYGESILQVVTSYDTEEQQKFYDNIRGINEAMGLAKAQENARTKSLQNLADAQRRLRVETAQGMATIEKEKLLAEDITKSYAVREAAAVRAFNKEKNLEDRRIDNAELAVFLEKQRHKLIGPEGVQAKDLDALADLEIELANVRQESAGRQISLQNFLNGLREQQRAQDKERTGELTKLPPLYEAVTEEIITSNDHILKNMEKNNAQEGKLTQEQVQMRLDAASNVVGALSSLAGDNKALAVAAATMDTYAAANGALATGKGTPIAWANAAAIVISGLANVKNILKTDVPGGGGGGGGGSDVSNLSSSVSAMAPSQQMASGTFNMTGAMAPEPVKAFVVTDEMTSSQNQLANIRRRATI